ncbi:MAG: hypothetical protein K2O01_02655 [Bacteroidales bacterium]|nr:hypothetical protein [Bacteroidales bacterium]
MSLVSCKQNEVKLHPSVGEIYNTASATSTMGGDGIIFHVDESAGYALVCSMNDLKRDRQTVATRDHIWESDFTWSVFGTDTVMEKDTIWAEVTRSIKHFVGKTSIDDSILPGSIVNEPEKFTRYDYEENDSVITIYPMLRYKAYKENGEQVLPPYEEATAYLGFIGELIDVDTILTGVTVELFSDTTWTEDTVTVGGRKYALAVNGTFESGENVTLYRPFEDTVERRTRTYKVMEAGYSDTLWNSVKKGDRKVMVSGEWQYALDTNWSFSYIGIGEEDPDGSVNTDKIVNADVPCRQKVTPDSSSAARTCRNYFTNGYEENRTAYAADTAFKYTQGQWYLPSRAELRYLFDAKNKINEMNAGTKGFEPLQNCYWSSNEKNAQTAWYKCFTDNGVESYIPKANNNYRVNIRAIRKVEWPLK